MPAFRSARQQTSARLAAVVFVLTGLLASSAAYAQDSDFAFLRIGTNAAAGAMGDAYVAHSRDAYATYWNPAGLAAATSNSLGLAYHAWLADVQTYGLAARFQAGARGGIGLFATAMGSKDLEAREGPGEPDGSFNVQYISTGIAYGRDLGPLRAGVTAKYLSERIFSETASGYAFDFGLQADLYGGGLQLGAALQNVGEMNELAAQASELPRTMRVGVAAFPFRILTIDDHAALLSTMLTAELVHVFTAEEDERQQFHFGAGVQLFDVLDFRAGLITNDPLRRFTAGLGLSFEGFRFDYAYLPFENDFQDPGHLLTLLYAW